MAYDNPSRRVWHDFTVLDFAVSVELFHPQISATAHTRTRVGEKGRETYADPETLDAPLLQRGRVIASVGPGTGPGGWGRRCGSGRPGEGVGHEGEEEEDCDELHCGGRER